MADQPIRVNFYNGQPLVAEDLRAEQEYHRRMRYLHNRLHGYGIVEGLEVVPEKHGVSLMPGLGIDKLGRELVLTSPLWLEVIESAIDMGNGLDLLLEWAEVPDVTRGVPGQEGFSVRSIEQPQPRLATPGTPCPEALMLARITRGPQGGLLVDGSVRRPLDR